MKDITSRLDDSQREKLGEVLRRFEGFGLPLHFTENTILSGALTPPEYDDLNDFAPDPWESTPEGEARQAAQIAKDAGKGKKE